MRAVPPLRPWLGFFRALTASLYTSRGSPGSIRTVLACIRETLGRAPKVMWSDVRRGGAPRWPRACCSLSLGPAEPSSPPPEEPSAEADSVSGASPSCPLPFLLPHPSPCPSAWPFPVGPHLANTRRAPLKTEVPNPRSSRAEVPCAHPIHARAVLPGPRHTPRGHTQADHQCAKKYPAASFLIYTCHRRVHSGALEVCPGLPAGPEVTVGGFTGKRVARGCREA